MLQDRPGRCGRASPWGRCGNARARARVCSASGRPRKNSAMACFVSASTSVCRSPASPREHRGLGRVFAGLRRRALDHPGPPAEPVVQLGEQRRVIARVLKGGGEDLVDLGHRLAAGVHHDDPGPYPLGRQAGAARTSSAICRARAYSPADTASSAAVSLRSVLAAVSPSGGAVGGELAQARGGGRRAAIAGPRRPPPTGPPRPRGRAPGRPARDGGPARPGRRPRRPARRGPAAGRSGGSE